MTTNTNNNIMNNGMTFKKGMRKYDKVCHTLKGGDTVSLGNGIEVHLWFEIGYDTVDFDRNEIDFTISYNGTDIYNVEAIGGRQIEVMIASLNRLAHRNDVRTLLRKYFKWVTEGMHDGKDYAICAYL